MEHNDIFDRIMNRAIFRRVKPFYEKHKEFLLYLFFGGLTFVISVASFALFDAGFHFNELIANIISWILAVAFAYITNRIWVFENKAHTSSGVVKEAVLFGCGRLFTLLLEEAILYIFITKCHFNSLLIKLVAQVVVIATNYLISKLIVFRKKDTEQPHES